jgi:O-succinylbenzoate synthase
VRATERLDDAPVRTDVACTAVVGRQASVGELLDRVGLRLAEGYGSVKRKIAPGWDLEPVRAVRERWPDLGIAADANGAYAEQDAAPGAVLHELDGLGLAYLEQPLPADDLAALARLTDAVTTPIALDGRSGASDLDDALRVRGHYVVNCKPASVGRRGAGIRRARSSEPVGVRRWSGTGRQRACAAFAAHPACDLPTDLGPSALRGPRRHRSGRCSRWPPRSPPVPAWASPRSRTGSTP